MNQLESSIELSARIDNPQRILVEVFTARDKVKVKHKEQRHKGHKTQRRPPSTNDGASLFFVPFVSCVYLNRVSYFAVFFAASASATRASTQGVLQPVVPLVTGVLPEWPRDLLDALLDQACPSRSSTVNW